MSDFVAALRRSVPRPTLRGVLTAPFRRRTYGSLTYLALAFPLGIAYFVGLTVGLSVSAVLVLLLVGVPLLLLTLLGVVAAATVERVLAETLLGVEIPAPEWKITERRGVLDRVTGLVTDPAVYAALVFVLSKFAVGVGAFVLLVVSLVVPLSLVATPLYYDTPGMRVGLFLTEDITRELSLYVPWNELVVGVEFVVRLTSWEVTTLPGALAMAALGLLGLVLALNVLNAVGWLCGRWARLLLSDRAWPSLRDR